jgi:ring-1,2-phenylacetyl-CoA epoxidase subunit PaaD
MIKKMTNQFDIAPVQGLDPGTEEIWKILSTVYDPEIPVLTITDLGIVRKVQIENQGKDTKIIVTITPTYSGCPAMDLIAMNTRLALHENGYEWVEIKNVLSPAWTTDWISEEAKQKLLAYGIAPPMQKAQSCAATEANEQMAVQCPQCKSYNTQLVSRFGSTACKSLYKCNDCLEPFDHFKCH